MPTKIMTVGNLWVDEIRECAYETRYPVNDLVSYKEKLKRLGVSFTFEIRSAGNILFFRYSAQPNDGRTRLIEAIEKIEKEVVHIMDDKNLIRMFNTKGG